MRLKVSLKNGTGDPPVRMVVEAEPAATVESLAEELGRAGGGPAGSEGGSPRLFLGPEPLDPAGTLESAGLLDGAELRWDRPAGTAAIQVGAVELRFVGGPGAGSIVQLPPGDYELGSGPQARIRLPGDAPAVAGRVRVRADGMVELSAEVAAELDGKPLNGVTPWRPGMQLAMGSSLIELATGVPARAPLRRSDDLGLDFNRPPRFVLPVRNAEFRLPTAPTKPERSPVPLVTLLLVPVLGSLVGILVTGNWKFIFIALISPLGALVNQFSGRKRGRLSYADQVEEYQAKLARVQEAIGEAVLEEQRARRFAYPDPALLGRIAGLPTDRLWERRWRDEDFLMLRVGTASVPSGVRVEDPTQDEFRRTVVPPLDQVPVPVDVRADGVIGVAGARVTGMARWLVAQAAGLHSPTDLRICVLTDRPGEPDWAWSWWLPHTRTEGEDAYAFIGTTAESVSRRITELNRLVANRAAAEPGRERGGAAGEPDVLVVLDGARRLRSLPGVISLLREGPAAGVYLICLDAEPRLLPEECRVVVTADETTASLRTPGQPTVAGVRADAPEPSWFDRIARDLAPLRATGDSEDAVLPASARLLDVLHLEPPAGDVIAATWAVAPRSTTAILGEGLDGQFSVDLVRDGPHTLIGGTTGSGKSELLQTLVATLAVANRPDEMTFMLVDYKGGSAFAECELLPHTVAMVTDLDTYLVERALISLGAELRRREHILAGIGASDIIRYNERRERDPSIAPMPRLLLVIDEFASMVRELPDFVTGLVNIAQRGRSLGIHLVLATQRPSGAVTADIRANTNLRIALRTTDQNESRDIIDAPDAGELSPRTPGRAYARLGFAALLPFQAGRIGGRRPSAGVARTQAQIRALPVEWGDVGGPVRTRPAATANGTAGTIETDLKVLVDAVVAAADTMGIARQPSPALPALTGTVLLDDLAPADARPAGDDPADLGPVAYGLVDLPAQQRQEPLVLDLDRVGHLHIVGSSRSGRSQALRTLAAALTRRHRTTDLHLYGVDCGNGALLALSGLPHSGAIVDRLQTERLGRMLDWFGAELARRQALLGESGVSDLTELRRGSAPDERLPHLVLMIDRFEVYDRDFAVFDNGSYLDRMLRLMRDGAGVGIHLLIAGDKTLASGRYAGSTEEKLILRLNDRSDYSSFGLNQKVVPPDQPPGRAIRAGDAAETQIAVLDADTSGAAQTAALTALAARITARDAGIAADRRPRRFGMLPDLISFEDAKRTAPAATRAMTAMVGVGGDEIVALGPDLVETPTFAIGGPPRSGRSTALLTVARSLLERGTGLLVVAPRRSPLRQLKGLPGVREVVEDAGIAQAAFRELLGSMPEETGVVVIDDAELVAQSDLDSDLLTFARGGAGNGWGLVVAGNAEALGLGLSGWMQQLKRNRAGLLLAPQSVTDGELIGLRIPRGIVGQTPPPGRGYLHLGDGRLQTVQVPRTV